MHLKTSPQYAIEGAQQLQGSYDLELNGCECVARVDVSYKVSVENGTICSSKNSFLSVYGLDCKFFYLAQQLKSGTVFKYEVGLGYLEKVDDKIILKRGQPLYFSENENIATPSNNVPRPFYCHHDEYVIVTTYVPRTYLELLTDDNCIITSLAPHVPSLTYVKENSIVGRFGPTIESIPVEQLYQQPAFINSVVDSISKHTKNLILKSSKLTAKAISADYILLKETSTRPPEKEGTLFFNKDSKTLCYYADNCWRELVWQRCLDENPS